MNEQNNDREVSQEAGDWADFFKKYEITRLRVGILDHALIFVVSIFGFIAALAWDEALKSYFKSFFANSTSISVKFYYAITITVLAIILSVIFGRRAWRRKKKIIDKEMK